MRTSNKSYAIARVLIFSKIKKKTFNLVLKKKLEIQSCSTKKEREENRLSSVEISGDKSTVILDHIVSILIVNLRV